MVRITASAAIDSMECQRMSGESSPGRPRAKVTSTARNAVTRTKMESGRWPVIFTPLWMSRNATSTNIPMAKLATQSRKKIIAKLQKLTTVPKVHSGIPAEEPEVLVPVAQVVQMAAAVAVQPAAAATVGQVQEQQSLPEQPASLDLSCQVRQGVSVVQTVQAALRGIHLVPEAAEKEMAELFPASVPMVKSLFSVLHVM